MEQAVIKTGGKQYLVKAGDKIKVEKLKGNEGDKVEFETLLTADQKGDKVDIGTPNVKAKVSGTILEQGKDKKKLVVKYKAKTRYLRRKGHRQEFTKVQIDKI